MSEVEVVENPIFTSGQVAENNAGRDVGAPMKHILDGLAGSEFNVENAVITAPKGGAPR